MDYWMGMAIGGILAGVVAGLLAGYRWGIKDGRRQRELEEAYELGQWDHGDRVDLEFCPYELDDELIQQWRKGWMDAERGEV